MTRTLAHWRAARRGGVAAAALALAVGLGACGDDDPGDGSDDPTTESFGPVQGMMVSYSASDPEDAERAFGALADGGTVSQPLIETFFSPAFGMCTDRFGTAWMVVADAPETP